jgi:hypothetical protein
MLIYKKTFITFLSVVLFIQSNSQKCCLDPVCKQKAKEYAERVTSLVTFLGKCTPESNQNFKSINDSILNEFSRFYPERYNEFKSLVKAISVEFIDAQGDEERPTCFHDQLPIETGDNTMAWINYIRDVKPVFPSTEFCRGFKKRVEISQGAAFLSKKTTAYLGVARFFVVYTLPGKEKCGGRVRLMVGPSYFRHSAASYLTLSSRIGVRIGDIKSNIFSLGNFNFFGGYSTAFGDFNYAETGLEVELGWLGFNLSTVYQTSDHNWGFLAGIILFNTKTKKKKEK